MEQLLCGFLSIAEGHVQFPYITAMAITNAIDIINTEYRTITTRELASRVNLDESYFIRAFSSVMGITPTKYIRAVRVTYGKELIKSGITYPRRQSYAAIPLNRLSTMQRKPNSRYLRLNLKS